ncbi:sigma-70 region 4 domain-containing protein [Nocardia sp. NPDC051463]|uniref:sigma-70 region 4 domain-containing protein n=1 Tax=Nocardia sp. NPDC051463 TaxID=3154845 RepID=UPI00344D24D5
MVAEWSPDGVPNGNECLPNGLRDTRIRDIAMRVLSRNWGKIENGPGGATNTILPGPYLRNSLEPGDEASMSVPTLATLEPETAQRYVVEMLDELRRQTELIQCNKPRYMLLARKYGLSHAEIAAVLGMSEGAVRQAVRRAKGTPGMEFDKPSGGGE